MDEEGQKCMQDFGNKSMKKIYILKDAGINWRIILK
jgi:hypothetical protein